MDDQEVKCFLRDEYDMDDVIAITRLHGGVVNHNLLIETRRGKFVLRVHVGSTSEEVAREVEILEHLARAEYPSPRIVATPSGELQTTLTDAPAILFDFIEGRTADEIPTEKVRELGSLIGQLHGALASFPGMIRRTEEWEIGDIKRHIREQPVLFRQRPFEGANSLLNFIQAEIAKLTFPEDLPRGLTHQDIKPSNIVLSTNGSMSIIDFDSMYTSALLHDLTTTAIWICFPERVLISERLTALVSGYESVRPLTEGEKEVFEDALRFRLLRESFVWPFRWLNPELAVYYGYFFHDVYLNLTEGRVDINALLWDTN